MRRDKLPVYAYSCGNCGLEFERMQRFSDEPITECPDCKVSSVQRVIQPVGIIFKGSGWYVKDSKAANSAGKPPDKSKNVEKDSSDQSSTESKQTTESKNNTVKESSSTDSNKGSNKVDSSK